MQGKMMCLSVSRGHTVVALGARGSCTSELTRTEQHCAGTVTGDQEAKVSQADRTWGRV